MAAVQDISKHNFQTIFATAYTSRYNSGLKQDNVIVVMLSDGRMQHFVHWHQIF